MFMCRSTLVSITLMLAALPGAMAHAADAPASADEPAFKPEQLEQMLAPIALYPDSLLSQMLMASTYPLEVVQADRWVKQNGDLSGDALAKALEDQGWDPSVKSLVNFPQVLAMMSQNLDVTVKIGDAFIGQQKQVMDTIQELRAKAQDTGNLKTTPQQTVSVEQQGNTPVIVIQPADPQVVCIPTYSPTVYYATWPYPAYPPAWYYPAGYVAGRALAFTAGVAVGVAWGYAWGNCNWRGGNVNINVNQNLNINRNINRSRYQAQLQARNTSIKNGQGVFRHDVSHRQGVAYRDQKTASQFGRVSTADAARTREAYRGRDTAGAQDLSRAGGITQRPSAGATQRPSAGATQRPSAAASPKPTTSNRQSAFDGVKSGGTTARGESSRGSASRSSAASRSGGGRSGGGRAGGRR
jgi:uncharacterized membrane protein YgcG